MAPSTAAVVVEKAFKYYGRKNKADYKPVLEHLDMMVERGIIYGLLGPSGCGKTTLLSCIVGRRKLDSGNVWVLGGKPGEKGSGVPGPRVGYMPQVSMYLYMLTFQATEPSVGNFDVHLVGFCYECQNNECQMMEIALVAEFSVRDAVYYFGRIYGMKPKKMAEKFEFLSNLLELPSGGRLIRSLSGGQQRRVSLAAALVHEPELLILDEPTVGLDPVLRERIWEFLSDLARKGTTVIITTHYIDETKQAHKIGLLRDGQLLAENSPEEILRQFECNTLEEAFLKMALRQHEEPTRRATLTSSPDVIPESRINNEDSRFQSREDFNAVTSSTDVLTKEETKLNRDRKSGRYKAVFIKNVQQFSRHPGGLIFSMLFPLIQVVAFFSAVGHDPWDLKVAVVNEEAAFSPGGWDACKQPNTTYTYNNEEEEICELNMLSCWFIEEMEKRLLYAEYYKSTSEARELVYGGSYYSGVHVSRNFSSMLGARLRDQLNDDPVVLVNGTLHVWIDMANHQVSNFVKTQLLRSYESFVKRVMRSCDRLEQTAQIPINFKEPVYGTKDPQYTTYMAPGVMITILYFLAAVVTSTIMISDRLEGVWERSAVAGVRPDEMLQVHIGIQAVVILVQTIEIMVLAFVWYGLPSKGSLTLVALMMFLQGLSGMCYGFLLSVCCSSFTLSFFIATGSFYPMILLCGILWPLEAMPAGLRVFSHALPFTYPIKTLRELMEKGTSFTHQAVYAGFITTVMWIGFILALCFLTLKLRKS